MTGEKWRGFFLSPDGQNGELYYALRQLGYVTRKYDAEYYWSVREKDTDWVIAYTEGDVDIYQLKEKL